jgi:hypothetical protein
MDAKKLFLDHFEKLAIGIAAIFLVLFALGFAKQSPAAAQQTNVAKANKLIQEKAEKASKEAPKPPQPTAAREVQIALEGGALPEKLPSWLFHKKPAIETKIEGVETPPAEHFAPTIDASKGDLGRIGLRWADAAGNSLVKIDKYVVYRAEGEANPENFKPCATLEAGKTSFTDAEVKTKTNYFYQVESHASVDESDQKVKNAAKKGFPVELAQEMRVLRSTIAGPLTTLPDVYLQLVQVTTRPTAAEIKDNPAEANRQASAYITVWKFFPDKKEWLKQPYTQVKPGEAIGDVQTVGAKKQDFTTDYKLIETKKIQIPKKMGAAEVMLDADAAVIEDVTTKQQFEINNQQPDAGLVEVMKNPKLGDAGDAPEKSKDKGKGK